MTEPIEEAVPETDFSDDLSDEALDRSDGAAFSRGSPCTKGCGGEPSR
jgi:hypothetical protein